MLIITGQLCSGLLNINNKNLGRCTLRDAGYAEYFHGKRSFVIP